MACESISDWIINPLPRIQQIFDECLNSNENWKEKTEKTFLEDLTELNLLPQIPWLNETPLHKLATHQVVRFRGMIQDMMEQEFFMDTFEIKRADGSKFLKPGRYIDVASCSPSEEIILHSPNCETSERTSYYCISIPGENEWVKEHYESTYSNLDNEVKSAANYKKRTFDYNESNNSQISDDAVLISESTQLSSILNCTSNDLTSDTKRLKDDCSNGNKATTAFQKTKTHQLNFPYPDMKGIACLVKVYEGVDMKLNDMIEVVGILSADPSIVELTGIQDDHEESCPPPSLVPRLHVLKITKKDHNNPLLPLNLSEASFPQPIHLANMRELLGSILDVALLGDGLASEYLLCHLVSSVYLRQNVMALGKFSVNLFGITDELQDQNYSKYLYELLQTLSTHCYYLSMTLENMNTLNFIPQKDYDANYLKSGLLQLPPHLHLVVDETKLTAGQLDVNGMKNLTALGNLINWQKVDYDFQFHNIEQKSNVPVLILSEGKSIIACDSHVQLNPKHTDVSLAFSKVSSMLNDHKILNQLRSHLTYAKLAPYSLPEDMQTKVQEDFVDSRQHENGMSADDLHSLLTIAKLLAQGCGQLTLTNDIWRSAKMLETERKGRLRK